MNPKVDLDPATILKAGIKALDPVLTPHGFNFMIERAGKGSGGRFASGRYVRGNRALELHVRHTLGLVTYHIGESTLDHENYLHFLGVYGKHSYPDFPSNPQESFQSLAKDLQQYCMDFVTGDGTQFCLHAAALRDKPDMFSGVP